MGRIKVYKFREYEKEYPSLYSKERRKLIKLIPSSCLIEHIGSTAVPLLPGKGVIDIMIASPLNKINLIKQILTQARYKEGYSSDKYRSYFKKEYSINGKIRRFHVQLVPINHSLFKKALAFRDYLIKNPLIAKEYSNLKEKALIECNDDGNKYYLLKDKFIKKHTRKAIKYSQKS